ncbi:expressed protein [Phakopsora pachyrhizi]|uniref:Expressed protein n=1 Tax=Phakopsora pachyrhizi TaxID=170000 RepID=A0AAV0AZG8_PHAPC|nr:expressed protein [Phakopsora pachyrhizi]
MSLARQTVLIRRSLNNSIVNRRSFKTTTTSSSLKDKTNDRLIDDKRIINEDRLPTKVDLINLRSNYLRASSNFSSFNFKQFFLRKFDKKFNNELPKLLSSLQSSSSSSSSRQTIDVKGGESFKAFDSQNDSFEDFLKGIDLERLENHSGEKSVQRLKSWWVDVNEELKVLERHLGWLSKVWETLLWKEEVVLEWNNPGHVNAPGGTIKSPFPVK